MNSEFSKEIVEKLASKLLINVNSEETELILAELDFIKENMDKISQIKGIADAEIQTHPFDLFENDLRDDEESEESPLIEDLLANAGKIEGREIEVPKVVG